MLTAEQRIEAYEYAIERLKAGAAPYVCSRIGDWLWLNGVYHIPATWLDEFSRFVPEKPPYKDSTRWFNETRYGNKTREIILLFCIEIAKDELAAQPFNKLN